METKRRRRISRELKVEAVRLAYLKGRRLCDLARELDVRPDLIRRWRGSRIYPTGEGWESDSELRDLRRRLAWPLHRVPTQHFGRSLAWRFEAQDDCLFVGRDFFFPSTVREVITSKRALPLGDSDSPRQLDFDPRLVTLGTAGGARDLVIPLRNRHAFQPA